MRFLCASVGLFQHDQIKDEISKQNALPFLLACAHKFVGKALVSILEILWSLTFFEDIARSLRTDTEFHALIQRIATSNPDEALKKAVDGLKWKLVQGRVGNRVPTRNSATHHYSWIVESASLEKVARQNEGDVADSKDRAGNNELVVGSDGEELSVTPSKLSSIAPSDGAYRYDMMISYCHADKELTYKIHKFLLAQGFKVWIDLDNMYGPGEFVRQCPHALTSLSYFSNECNG